MALIGDIRRNPWILIVFIALGLGGFIFMDSFSGERSVMGSQATNIGEINGTKIDQRQFARWEQTVYGNAGGDIYNRKSALWNYLVEDAIIKDEAESLGGLGVTKAEMQDLVFGNNKSPLMRARFPDVNQLNQLKSRLLDNNEQNNELRNYWNYLEQEVMKERKQAKLNALIQKGMYAPTWQLNQIHQEQNQQIDISYVRIPYGDIDDVELVDADYKAYIQKNKATLTQDEETRRLEYVAFDILPSAQDTASIIAKLEESKVLFANATNDTTFISGNIGGALDGAYFQRDQINSEVADALFDQPKGTTYGPYLEGNTYRVAKLIDQKVVPDSVRSRHILLPAIPASQVRIDSMITELEAGRANFTDLAEKFGTDGTKSTGGDLGYVGQGGMVKQFNDLIFYYADQGEYKTIITQFGIHLVEVTGKKFINKNQGARIGYISELIIPSEDTQDIEYRAALEFVSKNRTLDQLRAGAAEMGLSTEVAGPFKANDYIFDILGPGQTSRDIIQFAFNGNTDINDVSSEIYTYADPVTNVSNKHVIAALVSVTPAGLPSVADIKSDIENQVLNMKKAEMMKGKITETDLDAIANTYESQVDEATNINFSSGFATGLGSEPKVIAAAFDLEEGQTSKAIEGANGVYVVRVNRKSAVTSEPNIAQLRKTTGSSIGIQTTSQLMQSMKKDADIVDGRSRFF